MNNMLGNYLSAEGSFTIGIDKSSGRGTKIVLYIKEDQNEYLEELRSRKRKPSKLSIYIRAHKMTRKII